MHIQTVIVQNVNYLSTEYPSKNTYSDLFGLQLQGDRYDFFPMNRALSLVTMGEDSTESKIDELLHYVLALVQKQKEEVGAHCLGEPYLFSKVYDRMLSRSAYSRAKKKGRGGGGAYDCSKQSRDSFSLTLCEGK